MKILNILNMIIKYNNAIRTFFTSIAAARLGKANILLIA